MIKMKVKTFQFLFFKKEDMEQDHDADYSPSNCASSEEDNDTWL